MPQMPRKRKKVIQTVIVFPGPGAHEDESDSGKDKGSDSKRDEKPLKRVEIDRGVTNTGKKGKRKSTGFDWDKWRRTSI